MELDASRARASRRLHVLSRIISLSSFPSKLHGGLARSECLSSDELVPIAQNDDALIPSRDQYEALYERSIDDADTFWSREAKELYWKNLWDSNRPICSYNFDVRTGPIHIEWFRGGYTNICYNAVDRHVKSGNGGKVSVLWEGNDPRYSDRLTYDDLLKKICQLANFLRSRHVKKGDRVCIYMPMLPELPIAMLACARIGAVHSVVFGGFSAEAIAGRLLDCKPKVILTCSAVQRGNRLLPFKEVVDEALNLCLKKANYAVETCLVYDNCTAASRETIPWINSRDFWWQDVVSGFSSEADVEWLESEEPLFMLYTSGSTGKPKGVLHTVGGYMVYASTTYKYCFQPKPDDVYWCTADCGWITGHTYGTYGPLLHCSTCVIFEGMPTYPHSGRCWEIVDKYNVSIFYTAPTLIRTLEAQGNQQVRKFQRSKLRILATAGEPIDRRAWQWYFEVVGDKRCPILDTWWQTETGGIMITPLPGAWPLKPGSATLPFFGVQPAVLDQKGKEQYGPCEGYLCVKRPWPGMARTLYGDHKRFEDTYFSTWFGYYNTGDGCQRDLHGYITITGRVDDVINVSGHRISTGEVESALSSHPGCAEVAVVGFPHSVKGEGIYAYTVRMKDYAKKDFKKSLQDIARKEIGAFAVPDVVHVVEGLPKTRSGKIMRNILRKIAAGRSDWGDTSTLADPEIVSQIINSKSDGYERAWEDQPVFWENGGNMRRAFFRSRSGYISVIVEFCTQR